MYIYHWAKFRVYGDHDADEKITMPLSYHQHTVKTWKKAISSFMSNNQMKWIEAEWIGNPTKLALMAKLLKNIVNY